MEGSYSILTALRLPKIHQTQYAIDIFNNICYSILSVAAKVKKDWTYPRPCLDWSLLAERPNRHAPVRENPMGLDLLHAPTCRVAEPRPRAIESYVQSIRYGTRHPRIVRLSMVYVYYLAIPLSATNNLAPPANEQKLIDIAVDLTFARDASYLFGLLLPAACLAGDSLLDRPARTNPGYIRSRACRPDKSGALQVLFLARRESRITSHLIRNCRTNAGERQPQVDVPLAQPQHISCATRTSEGHGGFIIMGALADVDILLPEAPNQACCKCGRSRSYGGMVDTSLTWVCPLTYPGELCVLRVPSCHHASAVRWHHRRAYFRRSIHGRSGFADAPALSYCSAPSPRIPRFLSTPWCGVINGYRYILAKRFWNH
jgi:hypothetical protein